jgi:hypothetical protein
MNQIKEKLDIKSASCRVFNPNELIYLLKQNMNVFWSWGSRNFVVDSQKNTRMFRMTVSGYHHKGYVFIFLNGLDLFDVYLTNKEGIIKNRTDEMGLYFDQLVEWIDDKVERIPEYRF